MLPASVLALPPLLSPALHFYHSTRAAEVNKANWHLRPSLEMAGTPHYRALNFTMQQRQPQLDWLRCRRLRRADAAMLWAEEWAHFSALQ